MLTLHLIRHAKTQQGSESGKDIDRQLMDKGIAQANLLGNYLQSHHISLGKILCSTSIRTRQTQAIISQHLAEHPVTDYRKDLYHADLQGILQELAGETLKTLTLIGHNNGISDFVTYCTGEFHAMQTCEIITLNFPFDDWEMISKGTGTIALRYRPDVFVP